MTKKMPLKPLHNNYFNTLYLITPYNLSISDQISGYSETLSPLVYRRSSERAIYLVNDRKHYQSLGFLVTSPHSLL